MDNIKIDYIITLFRESEVIKIGLDALCNQSMRDVLRVILVNDCSPNTDCEYQDLYDEYKDKLDMVLIKTPYNCGPGLAKQFGIDASNNDYFILQDGDDCIASDDVIESFVKIISEHMYDDNICSIIGRTATCKEDFSIISVDNGGMEHGRVFYRKYFDKYNIKYVDELSRYYADSWLDSILKVVAHFENCINIPLDKTCYLYRAQLPESITVNVNKGINNMYGRFAIDMSLENYIVSHYNIFSIYHNKKIYVTLIKQLFNIITLVVILNNSENGSITEKEWDTLQSYRKYLINKTGRELPRYSDLKELFRGYKNYILGCDDLEYFKSLDNYIDKDCIEDLWNAYLSDDTTIYNCSYEQLMELIGD